MLSSFLVIISNRTQKQNWRKAIAPLFTQSTQGSHHFRHKKRYFFSSSFLSLVFPALLNDELSLREVGFSSRYEQKLTDVVMILLIAPLKTEQTQKHADWSGHPYQWDFPVLYPIITLSHLCGLGSGRLESTSHISVNTDLPSPHPTGRNLHISSLQKRTLQETH